MSAKPQRSYFSPQREEQANATRRRILAVAAELFAEDGFAAVTMPRIAQRSGLSLATVYLYFSGKATILGALADEIVSAPDLSVEHVEREADPTSQLRRAAEIMRRLNERSWLVADILRGAHGADVRLAEVWALWQRRHFDAIRRGVEALQGRGGLRPGLGLEEAVDAFYALAGTDIYRALVRERGWSPARYERWLFALGCRELLGVSPDEPSTGHS